MRVGQSHYIEGRESRLRGHAIVEAMLGYVGHVDGVLATTTACSFACAHFWLGNFIELCWRYLGSNIAGSVGPS